MKCVLCNKNLSNKTIYMALDFSHCSISCRNITLSKYMYQSNQYINTVENDNYLKININKDENKTDKTCYVNYL